MLIGWAGFALRIWFVFGLVALALSRGTDLPMITRNEQRRVWSCARSLA
jgi:hypothetical protein